MVFTTLTSQRDRSVERGERLRRGVSRFGVSGEGCAMSGVLYQVLGCHLRACSAEVAAHEQRRLHYCPQCKVCALLWQAETCVAHLCSKHCLVMKIWDYVIEETC